MMRTKFVYEGHWVMVTRAKNVPCYPATPTLQSEHDYNCQTALSLRRRGAACKHDIGKFHASYLCRLPYVSKCTYSRVGCLRLEGSLLLIKIEVEMVWGYRVNVNSLP